MSQPTSAAISLSTINLTPVFFVHLSGGTSARCATSSSRPRDLNSPACSGRSVALSLSSALASPLCVPRLHALPLYALRYPPYTFIYPLVFSLCLLVPFSSRHLFRLWSPTFPAPCDSRLLSISPSCPPSLPYTRCTNMSVDSMHLLLAMVRTGLALW